jgi:hypothetical protein
VIREKSRKVERLKQKSKANKSRKKPPFAYGNKKQKPKRKSPKTTQNEPKTKERNHKTKTLKTQPKNTRKTALKISLNASGMG